MFGTGATELVRARVSFLSHTRTQNTLTHTRPNTHTSTRTLSCLNCVASLCAYVCPRICVRACVFVHVCAFPQRKLQTAKGTPPPIILASTHSAHTLST